MSTTVDTTGTANVITVTDDGNASKPAANVETNAVPADGKSAATIGTRKSKPAAPRKSASKPAGKPKTAGKSSDIAVLRDKRDKTAATATASARYRDALIAQFAAGETVNMAEMTAARDKATRDATAAKTAEDAFTSAATMQVEPLRVKAEEASKALADYVRAMLAGENDAQHFTALRETATKASNRYRAACDGANVKPAAVASVTNAVRVPRATQPRGEGGTRRDYYGGDKQVVLQTGASGRAVKTMHLDGDSTVIVRLADNAGELRELAGKLDTKSATLLNGTPRKAMHYDNNAHCRISAEDAARMVPQLRQLIETGGDGAWRSRAVTLHYYCRAFLQWREQNGHGKPAATASKPASKTRGTRKPAATGK